MALFLSAGSLFAQDPAGEGEGGSPAGEGMGIPDPNQPAPRGEDPGAWRTWVTDQKIRRSDRMSITIGIGGMYGLFGKGADMFDDNSYSAMFKPNVTLMFELGFTLMPLLNIFAGVALEGFADNSPALVLGPDRYESHVDDQIAKMFYAGVRVKFPVRLLGSRLFCISKAENGYGFVPYLKFGAGASMLNKVDVECYSSTINIDQRLYEDSTGLFLTFGLGLELRTGVFGGFIETCYSHLGTPQLSAAFSSQSAGAMRTLYLAIGIAFYI